MKKIIIIGGKGTAVDIAAHIADAHRRYHTPQEVLGFAFDDPAFGPEINGFPVLCGTREAWPRYRDDAEVGVIFMLYRYDLMQSRSALRESYGIPDARWATFVHPDAFRGANVSVGPGSVVMARCTLNSNVKLGSWNILSAGIDLGHDCVVGDQNFFGAQVVVGGLARIGHQNFIGLNTGLRDSVIIGNNNIVGMGANVTADVDNDQVVIGNPAVARPRKQTPVSE